MLNNDFFNQLNKINEEEGNPHFIEFLYKNPSFISDNIINTGSHTPPTSLVGYCIANHHENMLIKLKKNFPVEFDNAISYIRNDIGKHFPYIFFEGFSLRSKKQDIKKTIKILKNINEDGILNDAFRNPSFLSHINLDENPTILHDISGIIEIKELLSIKKGEEYAFLKKLDYSTITVNDLSFLNVVLENLSLERSNPVILSEKESFIRRLWSCKINEKTGRFIKQKQLEISPEINIDTLCKYSENEYVSSPMFFRVFNNEVNGLIKNKPDELMSLLHHCMFKGMEGIVLPILEEHPHLLYMKNSYTDKPLWQLFFDRSHLSDASVYSTKEMFDFIERNNIEKHNRDLLFRFIINEVTDFKQEDINKIFESHISLSNIENFKPIFYKMKEQDLEISFTPKFFRDIEDFSTIYFLKEQNCSLERLPNIIQNKNFLDYMKYTDNEEKKELAVVMLVNHERLTRLDDSQKLFEEIFEVIQLTKNLEQTYCHERFGSLFNATLYGLNTLQKKSDEGYVFDDIYISSLKKSISAETIVKDMKNDFYSIIENTDFDKLSEKISDKFPSILHSLIESGDLDFLEIFISKNIDKFAENKENLLIIDKANSRDPLKMVNINNMLLKKAINIDLDNNPQNTIKRRI